MKALSIASVLFAVNAAMLRAEGDTPIADTLEGATPEYQKGMLGLVENFMADPAAALPPLKAETPTPEQVARHARQSALARSLIDALKAIPDAAPAEPVVPVLAKVPAGVLVPVKYVGRREVYKEGAYGSGLIFETGRTLMVSRDLADKLLRHPDVYVLGEAGGVDVQAEAQAEVKKPAETEEERTQELRDSIAHMNSKAAVAQFILENFAQTVDPNKSKLADLREKAIQLIDQVGVPA